MTEPTNGLCRYKFIACPGEEYCAVEIERTCAGGCGLPAMPGQKYCEECHDQAEWLLERRKEELRKALRQNPGFRAIDMPIERDSHWAARVAFVLLKLAILLAFGALAFGRWWIG